MFLTSLSGLLLPAGITLILVLGALIETFAPNKYKPTNYLHKLFKKQHKQLKKETIDAMAQQNAVVKNLSEKDSTPVVPLSIVKDEVKKKNTFYQKIWKSILRFLKTIQLYLIGPTKAQIKEERRNKNNSTSKITTPETVLVVTLVEELNKNAYLSTREIFQNFKQKNESAKSWSNPILDSHDAYEKLSFNFRSGKVIKLRRSIITTKIGQEKSISFGEWQLQTT